MSSMGQRGLVVRYLGRFVFGCLGLVGSRLLRCDGVMELVDLG